MALNTGYPVKNTFVIDLKKGLSVRPRVLLVRSEMNSILGLSYSWERTVRASFCLLQPLRNTACKSPLLRCGASAEECELREQLA